VKGTLTRLGLWALRNVVLRIPSVRKALLNILGDIDSRLTPLAVLTKAIARAVPGDRDDQIAAELTEIPAKVWIATRGTRLTLPTGRTLAQEYEAIRESVRGD